MFDWRAIKRWGLKESELPPGSIVINRQPTVWEAYKRYIIPGIAVMFAEALLIFAIALAAEAKERKRNSAARERRALASRRPHRKDVCLFVGCSD